MRDGLTVLLVDDIEPMRKITAAQLASLGITRVLVAVNGAEALKMLQMHPVDVVLSDWNMPEMNGLQLLNAMRADRHLVELPFIMITAESERARIEEAIANGVSDLLVKPYSTGRLGQGLERALNRQRPPPAIPPPAPPADQPKLTVLLVDDRPDNLHLLVGIFKNDYRILAADSGAKALALCCSDTPPDLVLLDVMMPGLDGFEVARRMREHPNSAYIPVIFVTAATDDASRLQGLSLGAVDFVAKPADPVLIKLRVDNLMRYVRLRRQLQADYDNMLEAARLREDVEEITRHDMRSPLSTVLSMLQGMMGDVEIARRHAIQLELAERATMKLLDMINLSSELYKIETGRYALAAQPVPIGDIVRRIAELARSTYAGRQLLIVVDSDVAVGKEAPQALGDTLLTYSMLQILLKHACESAPERGRVTMTLADGDPLRVAIGYKGALPLPQRGRFFDKFTGTSGQGAYAARLMAEAQHGSVLLAVSDQHDTTTITIALPRT